MNDIVYIFDKEITGIKSIKVDWLDDGVDADGHQCWDINATIKLELYSNIFYLPQLYHMEIDRYGDHLVVDTWLNYESHFIKGETTYWFLDCTRDFRNKKFNELFNAGEEWMTLKNMLKNS